VDTPQKEVDVQGQECFVMLVSIRYLTAMWSQKKSLPIPSLATVRELCKVSCFRKNSKTTIIGARNLQCPEVGPSPKKPNFSRLRKRLKLFITRVLLGKWKDIRTKVLKYNLIKLLKCNVSNIRSA
jgi:hypothetical protein